MRQLREKHPNRDAWIQSARPTPLHRPLPLKACHHRQRQHQHIIHIQVHHEVLLLPSTRLTVTCVFRAMAAKHLASRSSLSCTGVRKERFKINISQGGQKSTHRKASVTIINAVRERTLFRSKLSVSASEPPNQFETRSHSLIQGPIDGRLNAPQTRLLRGAPGRPP